MFNNEKIALYFFDVNDDDEQINEIKNEIFSVREEPKYDIQENNLYSGSNEQILINLQDNIFKFKTLFIILVNHNQIPDLFNVLEDKANKELYTSLKIIILLNKDDQAQYESIKNDKIYNDYPFFDPDLICKNIAELKNCLEYGKKKDLVENFWNPVKVILTTINNNRDFDFLRIFMNYYLNLVLMKFKNFNVSLLKNIRINRNTLN